jgi:hypothetical protein
MTTQITRSVVGYRDLLELWHDPQALARRSEGGQALAQRRYTRAMVAARMAQLARQPVGTVSVHEQVGRFVRINYTLAGRYKGAPDIILPMVYDAEVDDALLCFQAARIKKLNDYQEHFGIPMHRTEQTWYQDVMEKARALVQALPRLGPLQEEAMFFMAWMSDICAYGLNFYERSEVSRGQR